MLLVLAVSLSFGSLHRTARLRNLPTRRKWYMCDIQTGEEDWRDVRARLVAQERLESQPNTQVGDSARESPSEKGFMYESPLIEQGSVILGGTQQEFGFALRQQYFHKSVMLLLQHDDSFTKGIILNRPSALELNGWRVWFGGDVAEGGTFHGFEGKGPREIVCLHSLQTKAASRLSMPVIRGVSHTTLEGALELVKKGEACKTDFWLFVGYAGWAPKQLQSECERDSWYLASADSAVLLRELLRQGTELPPPSAGEAIAGDGLQTWERLMRSIGKSDEVERTRQSLEDRMLKEWVALHLLPRQPSSRSAADTASSSLLPQKPTGLVLRSGRNTTEFLLDEQYLHKALLLLLHETNQGVCICVVLNRPTANAVQLNLPGRPRRHILFGGDARLRAGGLDVDSNGLLWLHRKPELGGTAIGDSQIWRVSSTKAATSIKEGEAHLADFLIVGGAVAWEREVMLRLLADSDLEPVPGAQRLWNQVWALADAADGTAADIPGSKLSDGTIPWWVATQLVDKPNDGESEQSQLPSMQALPPSGLADEALQEW
eukprot:CAMPEP_0119329650 /NCGR_PEP_ID=MMETSP1333-20130426/76351_1 /TAXON_ID=418940 /ORGANISM="Scyphosphaera apsteinii, Strain RCC1455" /LENGTH=546 /DNA_ID=CAMNT_0007338819 /DNA_START=61 /DNA_END=1698 /DNA_ORIENTATION=-